MASLTAEQLAALEQAAHWYTRLNDTDATAHDREAWQAWLGAAPTHAWAWQQAERLQQRLHRLPGALAERTLGLAGEERRAKRRSVLKGLALLLGSGTLGWGGYREAKQGPWFADYRSAVGERLPVTLADGSQLLLNTDTAVDVIFDAGQRRVLLRQGEVMVTTAADPQRRPFSVHTTQGTVRALGTRFSVRDAGAWAQVAVFEHAVQITPEHGSAQRVEAGQGCRFDRQQLQAPQALDYASGAWSRGLLIANDQRLDDFVAELGRYRQGWLRCDPAVGHLRISGTFALGDSEQILQALVDALPIRAQRRTRFWVTLTAA
ncbi:FecR domain-containing protein [Pseudomonas aegrilactucae]|uniref:FecR domain-containing protein n=1 Tax=Pseudomonas aegrilactucae TaxID=2854028 RepID=A0A9Q2XJU4_9PSED|nr:FecR domain-containing protein [Pseudomonas aegrilactucae]MBV6287441.1 FecR domain-containing protein [Pseudomonas aegrilactucae]